MAVKDLKRAYLSFLGERKYEWNIVLNPKRRDTADQARVRAHEYLKRLDRALLGRKWERKTEERLRAAYWREKADGIPHIHALVKFNATALPSDDGLKMIMTNEWGRLDNHGRLYAFRIRSTSKSISYNMKQIRSEEDFDNLFFYP